MSLELSDQLTRVPRRPESLLEPAVRRTDVAPTRGARIQRLFLRLAPLAAALFLSGCDWAVLDPKGPIADANAMLLVDSVAIMLVIVVPTIVATLGIAWWFRSSNQRAFYLPDWEYSGQLELIVWAIPLLTIMLLGGVTWIGAHDLDPAKPLVSKEEPLNVQVVSLDWKWLFIYPDQHVASVNRLVIPAGTPIRFALTSGSVMTAFFVPRLGSMIYTMNRMRTQLYLSADDPGVFNGLATQISGDGFADMHFEVEFEVAPGLLRLARPGARRRTDVDAGELHRALQTKRRSGAVHLPNGHGWVVREDSRSDAAARTRPSRRDRPRHDRGDHCSAVRREAELACSAS